MRRRRFTKDQQSHIDQLVEKRLDQQRRRYEATIADLRRELAVVSDVCASHLRASAEGMERLRDERNELLNATWALIEERNRLEFARRWARWFSDPDRLRRQHQDHDEQNKGGR